MTVIARSDTFHISFSVDGHDYGVCEKASGGKGDSEDLKVKSGGMGPEYALGGSVTREDITISKLFDLDGVANDYAWLDSRRGKGNVQITFQPLDHDGNVYGAQWTRIGTLKSVSPPDYDAAGNDAAMIELEVSLNS